MVFVNVIVPVALVAGIGFLFARCTKLGTTSPTKLSFYVLSPALIFHSLISHSIAANDLTSTVVFVAIVFSVLFAFSLAGTRLLGWDKDTSVASILSLCLNNNGNYGLPVLLFAFGEAGFALGVIYMVTQMAFVVVFGVGVASWEKGMSIRRLLLHILKVPVVLRVRTWRCSFATFSISLPLPRFPTDRAAGPGGHSHTVVIAGNDVVEGTHRGLGSSGRTPCDGQTARSTVACLGRGNRTRGARASPCRPHCSSQHSHRSQCADPLAAIPTPTPAHRHGGTADYPRQPRNDECLAYAAAVEDVCRLTTTM